jgi:hypothetical protein
LAMERSCPAEKGAAKAGEDAAKRRGGVGEVERCNGGGEEEKTGEEGRAGQGGAGQSGGEWVFSASHPQCKIEAGRALLGQSCTERQCLAALRRFSRGAEQREHCQTGLTKDTVHPSQHILKKFSIRTSIK